MLFPPEYSNQATALHKAAAALSFILIAATVVGMAVFFALRGHDLPSSARIVLGYVILCGAPAGLILIAIVNTSLSRRVRAHLLAVQSRERVMALSSSDREALLKTMPHTRYDYHNESKSFTVGGIIIAIFIIGLTITLYAVHSSPKVLIFGISMLIVVSAQISIAKTVLSKQRQGTVTLTSEGIQYTKDQTDRIMLWDGVREIKSVRYGYTIRSDQAEFMIWNEIRPVDAPKKIIQIGEPDAKKLVDQIRAMNPNIVYVEPFLARNLRIPISDKTAATFIFVIIALFIIVTIVSLYNMFW